MAFSFISPNNTSAAPSQNLTKRSGIHKLSRCVAQQVESTTMPSEINLPLIDVTTEIGDRALDIMTTEAAPYRKGVDRGDKGFQIFIGEASPRVPKDIDISQENWNARRRLVTLGRDTRIPILMYRDSESAKLHGISLLPIHMEHANRDHSGMFDGWYRSPLVQNEKISNGRRISLFPSEMIDRLRDDPRYGGATVPTYTAIQHICQVARGYGTIGKILMSSDPALMTSFHWQEKTGKPLSSLWVDFDGEPYIFRACIIPNKKIAADIESSYSPEKPRMIFPQLF